MSIWQHVPVSFMSPFRWRLRQTCKQPNHRVEIREFRDKLARFLLESDTPVAITQHGDTVGYYIPARRKRSETYRAELKEASIRWQRTLSAAGISEEDGLKDFQQWRKKETQMKAPKRLVQDANILLLWVLGAGGSCI